MNVRTALITACFFIGSTAHAQSPAPAQQPGTPAKSAKPPATPPAAPSQLLPVFPPPPEKLDPAKDAAIRHLMEVAGTSKVGDQILNGMTAQIRKTLSSSLPPDRLQKLMDAFSQNAHQRVSPEQVEDAMVPIYASHFSMEDVKGLSDFYESPLGQRVVKALPQVSQESQSAATQLVRGNVFQVLQGMTDDYPELKPFLQNNNGARPQSAPGATQPEPAAPPASSPPSPHLSQPSPPPHQ
jgi:hypothetical protein